MMQKEPTPISAGVSAVENEDGKENYFNMQPRAVTGNNEIGAFAVAPEPNGGIPRPAGEMYAPGITAAN